MIFSLGIEIRSILNEKLNNFQLKFKTFVKPTIFFFSIKRESEMLSYMSPASSGMNRLPSVIVTAVSGDVLIQQEFYNW